MVTLPIPYPIDRSIMRHLQRSCQSETVDLQANALQENQAATTANGFLVGTGWIISPLPWNFVPLYGHITHVKAIGLR